ncbi:hypothetical protein BX070DRAFT_217944 [Coemansia spiralis]|nr:hypothetical protein BX070DRAFT_217944 [Coemansia spiralis]
MTTHRRRTSKLSQEPNPFEQSFSRVRSEDVLKSSFPNESALKAASPKIFVSLGENGGKHVFNKLADKPSEQGLEPKESRPSSTPSSTVSFSEPPTSASSLSSSSSSKPTQKITLPPVTAITTPLNAANMAEAWGPESLRSGPLSPAMLGGPATNNMGKPQARFTPRLGLTDPVMHTGLTPFISGEAQPAISSAAFENIRLPSSLATPGFQSVLRAAINGHEITTTPGGSLHIASNLGATKATEKHRPDQQQEQEQEQEQQQQQQERMDFSKAASDIPVSPTSAPHEATSLSTMPGPSLDPTTLAASDDNLGAPVAARKQQKQRSNSAAAATTSTTSTTTTTTSKHVIENSRSSTAADKAGHARQKRHAERDADYYAATPAPSLPPPPPTRAKRARSGNAGALKNNSQNEPPAEEAAAAAEKKKKKAGTKKQRESTPANEEDEKRKQFLERNRVAALKCRQRKKKQLKELQDRHDYIAHENDRLRNEYMHMREQALQLRALLTAHNECSVARANGVYGTDNLPAEATSLQPLLFANGAESEQAKEIIAAIPPASNGVPVHSIDATTGRPLGVLSGAPPPHINAGLVVPVSGVPLAPHDIAAVGAVHLHSRPAADFGGSMIAAHAQPPFNRQYQPLQQH